MEDNALSNAILERGVFYYPAWRHYGNPDFSVTCDRCKRTGILACIGFERYDYCLTCVDAIVKARPQGPGPWHPDYLPSRSEPMSDTRTLMMQNIYRPTDAIHPKHYITAMAQDFYGTQDTHSASLSSWTQSSE